ncbi:MAG: hypothetical protein ABIP94_25265 [Planctomycetota bacterium]
MPGTDGWIYTSILWDPDGAGPAAPQLAIAGSFAIAGGQPANSIAAWDPISGSWAPLGLGIAGSVRALTALPNGDLIAGGSFTAAGGVAANSIARWDGNTWSPLGAGVAGGFFAGVAALAVDGNGDLLVGGSFTSAGGQPASRIARWNGTGWSPLGGGVAVGSGVSTLAMLPNGDLVVGGDFTLAGATVVGGVLTGVPAAGLARWSGGSWSAFSGGGATGGSVEALLVLQNGDLVVGGSFTSFGGAVATQVVSRNGSTWSAIGAGLGAPGDQHQRAVFGVQRLLIGAGGAYGSPRFDRRRSCESGKQPRLRYPARSGSPVVGLA